MHSVGNKDRSSMLMLTSRKAAVLENSRPKVVGCV